RPSSLSTAAKTTRCWRPSRPTRRFPGGFVRWASCWTARGSASTESRTYPGVGTRTPAGTAVAASERSGAARPPESGVSVVLAAVELDAVGPAGFCGAAAAFHQDHGIRGESRCERLEGALQFGIAELVGRVEERDVPGGAARTEKGLHRLCDHRDRRRPTRSCAALDQARVLPGGSHGGLTVVDERHARSAPGCRLQSQRAGARVEVDHARACEQIARLERREDGLAHAIARGSRARTRDCESERAGEPGNYPCHRAQRYRLQSPFPFGNSGLWLPMRPDMRETRACRAQSPEFPKGQECGSPLQKLSRRATSFWRDEQVSRAGSGGRSTGGAAPWAVAGSLGG